MSASDTNNMASTEEQPGGLQEHLRLKLELAATIRSVMQLFHQAKDDRREGQARRLLSRLAEDRFNLVVVGQFKRGKSSLINAIIGMDRLPTGILPLTSVVTTVRYGDRECVLIQHRGSSQAEEIPLARLEEYVTEKGNPGNRRHVRLAEVLLPSEVLRLGFHFIDTPGVGSGIVANTATTLGFLPEADAVIFVTSFESMMNEGELVFLRTVAEHVHNIFFVVNKLDLVSSQESAAVLVSVRQIISTELGDADPQVFAVSAREGLEAKLEGNSAMLARSGLPELESALTHFLTSESKHISVLGSIERALALLTPERVESRAGLSGESAQSIKREWERRMEQIETECLQAVEALRRHVRSELPSRFEGAIADHCAEVRDSLLSQVDRLLAGRKKSITAQDLRELVDRAGTVADERRRQWLSAHQGEFEEVLWTLAVEGTDQLERLYSDALEFAAGLFGMQPIAKWTISKDEANFSWRTATPFEWQPRFAWELDVFPVRWVRKRVRRDYCRTLEVATTAYRERVTQALAEAGSVWAGHLSSEVQDGLKDLGVRITGVLSGQAASALSGEVAAVLSRLEAMRQEFSERNPDKATILPPIPQRRSIRRCLVCERIESELFDFFSKRQYELSVNEAEQREHASVGGFCPLHTWQYERIASPRDVCHASAPLLAAIARHLRNIASSAPSPDSMRDRIRDLNPSADRCPACRRTAAVEKKAIDELRQMSVSGEDEDDDTGLCVRHLAAVLDRETDLEAARILDRISEDMQTYALKRDALRQELASDEEHMAYIFGLSLLVGHRGLSVA